MVKEMLNDDDFNNRYNAQDLTEEEKLEYRLIDIDEHIKSLESSLDLIKKARDDTQDRLDDLRINREAMPGDSDYKLW